MVPGALFNNKDAVYLKITHKYKTTVKEYLNRNSRPLMRETIERQVGRKVQDEEQLEVFEFDTTYEWALPKG